MTWINRLLVTGMALLAAGSLSAYAQTTNSAGAARVSTQQLSGVVVHVEGNWLVAKMLPDGEVETFQVSPTQEFVIDGRSMKLADLKPGMVLTATVRTTMQPVTARTVEEVTGTLVLRSGPWVTLRHPNGELHTYTVGNSYRFIVDGQSASLQSLQTGMEVTGRRITEDTTLVLTESTAVRGFQP